MKWKLAIIFVTLVSLNANALTREEWVDNGKKLAVRYIDAAMENYLAAGNSENRGFYKNLKMVRAQFDKVKIVWSKPGEPERPVCIDVSKITGQTANLGVEPGEEYEMIICEKSFTNPKFATPKLAQILVHEAVHTLQDGTQRIGRAKQMEDECEAKNFEIDVMTWAGVGNHFEEGRDRLLQACKMGR